MSDTEPGNPADPGRGTPTWRAAVLAALEAAPRVALAELPTPLQPLPRLSAELGAEIWIKRDDLSGLGLGGNKVRKLEYLLGDALASGCDTVVTFGALQSNHARQTAAACARAGLSCHLVLTRSVPRTDPLYTDGGNRLLDDLFGAVVHECDDTDDALGAALVEVEGQLAAAGAQARWIPPGGSEPIGCLGYVAAGLELADQLRAVGVVPSKVVVASSTGGTQAGLLLGLRAAGVGAEVLGVAVYRDAASTHEAVTLLAGSTAELLGMGFDDTGIDDTDVVVTGSQLGDGYGIPTDAMRAALGTVARSEGVVLDPVYSAKAAAVLFDGDTGTAASGDPAQGPTVFVHTGGSPAVFAYGRDALRGG